MASSFRKKKTQPYASLSIDPTTLVSSDALPPPSSATTIVVTGRNDGNTATIQGLHSMRTSPLSDTNTRSAPDTPSSAVISGGVFQPLPLTIQVRGTDVSDNIGTPRSVIPTRVGSLGGGLDMSLGMSPESVKMTLKQNIRACIFRYVKFWDRDEHGPFSEEPNTVCGIVLRLCHVLANKSGVHAPTWWRDTKHFVIKTHTDQRNNCIKTMHIRFNEIVKAADAATPCQVSALLLSNYLQGGSDRFLYLLGLRNNKGHYLQFIDTFAPCVVGKFIWNNDANMERVCSSVTQHEFESLFSVSDEAFVLLLVDNYAERWVAEAKLQKQVGMDTLTEEQENTLPITKYTFSRQKGRLTNGGGSGWSDEGHKRYNLLYRLVQRDRRQSGASFNKELLKVFQARRLRDRKQNVTPSSSKKRKTVAFDDLNPPSACDDDEDLLGFLLTANTTSI